MIITLMLIALLGSAPAMAAESCSARALQIEFGTPQAQKLFYKGTCHYRNQDYEKAAEYWTALTRETHLAPEFRQLQINAHNNLGFLYFLGRGVAVNKEKALQHWQHAVSQGHGEAEYHLCHAYAERGEPTFDAEKAVQHCEQAQRFYRKIDNKDKNEARIFKQIERYLNALKQ